MEGRRTAAEVWVQENASVGDGARHGTCAWRADGREARRRERLPELGVLGCGSCHAVDLVQGEGESRDAMTTHSADAADIQNCKACGLSRINWGLFLLGYRMLT